MYRRKRGHRKRTVRALSVYRPRRRRSVVYMARRRGGFRGRRSGGFGGMKSMISPILAGVADSYIDPMSPVDGLGATAVGFFMHNETMKNLGLYKVGFSLGNILPLPRLGGGGLGGGL